MKRIRDFQIIRADVMMRPAGVVALGRGNGRDREREGVRERRVSEVSLEVEGKKEKKINRNSFPFPAHPSSPPAAAGA